MDGLMEASRPHAQPRRPTLNPRTLTAPLAAITMAGLLFVYARSSIRAAKRNAQRHREADGGEISWHNENLRRHGQLKRPEEGIMRDLFWGKDGDITKAAASQKTAKSPNEDKLRARMGKVDRGSVDSEES
ncbi:MAG: hypothetical protein M1822_001432 [Bathelium mastoideum]|nr:MAG: hypothetical protein M1822_001432 [Bathelium mastoideum]